MLVDAAKGLEAQTMKLFDVCRRRGIPIITASAGSSACRWSTLGQV